MPATVGGEGMPKDFTIQTSADGTTWATKVTRTAAPLIAGEQSFGFAPVDARFVRISATSLRQLASDGDKYRLQLNEILVGGSVNLAPNALPSASSSYETTAWALARLADGDTAPADNGWTSNSQLTVNHAESVTLDFGGTATFRKVTLFKAGAGAFYPRDLEVAVSSDGGSWATVSTATNVAVPASSASYTFATQNARFVRITGTSLRQNPADANHFRMALAEAQVE